MVNNNNIEVFFQFDTTGSMYPCIGQVRKYIEGALTPLFKELPNLKIGIGANGDYCDANHPYVTKYHNLTSNIFELTQFVRTVPPTGGGDLPEAYELVLREVQNLNWSLDSKKILVLIADDVPHDENYYGNKLRIKWRDEAAKLNSMGIQVYSVQCLNKYYAKPFYSELARITNGYHLNLDQFNEVVDLILAIVYKQAGGDYLKDFEQKIEREHKMTRSMDATFDTLFHRDSKGRFAKKPTTGGLVPVEAGRFQRLYVEKDCDIKTFVEDNRLIFHTGKGFYQFTKPEDVQEHKEVVLRDKASGDMYSGDTARNMIGVPPGTRGRVRPDGMLNYDVFIQSTSYNRRLKANTFFLYEVDMDR